MYKKLKTLMFNLRSKVGEQADEKLKKKMIINLFNLVISKLHLLYAE